MKMVFLGLKKMQEYETNFYSELNLSVVTKAIESIQGREFKRAIVKKKTLEDKLSYILSFETAHKTFLSVLLQEYGLDDTVVYTIDSIKSMIHSNEVSAKLCFFYSCISDKTFKSNYYKNMFELFQRTFAEEQVLQDVNEKHSEDFREEKSEENVVSDIKKMYVGKISYFKGAYTFFPKYLYENGLVVSNPEEIETFPPEGKLWLDNAADQLSNMLTERMVTDRLYFAIEFSKMELLDNDRSQKIAKKLDVKDIKILQLNDLEIYRVVPHLSGMSDVPEKDNQLYIPTNNYYMGEKVIVRFTTEEGAWLYLQPSPVQLREKDNVYYISSEIKASKYASETYNYATIQSAEVSGFDYNSDYMHSASLFVYGSKLEGQKFDKMSAKDLLKAFVSSINSECIDDGKIDLADLETIIENTDSSQFDSKKIPVSVLDGRKYELIDYLYSFQDMEEFQEAIFEAIAKIIETGSGGKYDSNEYLKALIERIIAQPELLRSIQSYKVVQDKLAENKKARDLLSEEIETLEKQKSMVEEEAKKISESQKQELLTGISTEIDQKREELAAVTETLARFKEESELYFNYEEIKAKSKEMNRQYDILVTMHSDKAAEFSALETQYNAEKLRYEIEIDKLLASKELSARTNKVIGENKKNAEEAAYRKTVDSIYALSVSEEKFSFETEIIDRIQQVREYSTEDIINIFACIYTGFLTVFSGKPGTGKTSICNIIAEVMGCNSFSGTLDNSEINCNRYVSVSVERGWATKRDFLGYFNPLTKEFDKSNKHIYDALSIQNYEVVENKERYPMFILLDEANLSPLEYYWGDFMKIADTDSPIKELNLGNDIVRKVSNNLRFLATINNDHTTEELSPRLVDRSWIVELPKTPMVSKSGTAYSEISNNSPVTWSMIENTFKEKQCVVMPAHVQEIYTEIQRLFEKNGVSIGHRSFVLMERYVLVTQNLFGEETVTALDYAVLQKLVPMINGNGIKFEDFLNEFKDLCNNKHLIRSKVALEKIIKRGVDNMSYFNYFN